MALSHVIGENSIYDRGISTVEDMVKSHYQPEIWTFNDELALAIMATHKYQKKSLSKRFFKRNRSIAS